MKKQEIAKTIGLLIIFAAIVLFVFFRMTQNASQRQDKPKEQTELEKLLSYDFDNEYPKTARDVMKLYCRYLKAVYSKDTSDEAVGLLNSQMRRLYAKELLDYNDESGQLEALKEERASYKKEKMSLVGYVVAEASQIVYDTIDDVEYARIRVTLNLKAGASASKEYTYVLMKDAADCWKVYGWAAEE